MSGKKVFQQESTATRKGFFYIDADKKTIYSIIGL